MAESKIKRPGPDVLKAVHALADKGHKGEFAAIHVDWIIRSIRPPIPVNPATSKAE